MSQLLEDATDPAMFHRIMDVNYFGCVDCTSAALPFLKRSRAPHIAVVSSFAGKIGIATRTGYCASKWALHGFFESLRQEVGPKYGMLITLLCPGTVQTEINETRLGDKTAGFSLSLAQPVDVAGRIIINAISKGLREELFVPKQKFGRWFFTFFPWITDLVSRREALKLGIVAEKKE